MPSNFKKLSPAALLARAEYEEAKGEWHSSFAAKCRRRAEFLAAIVDGSPKGGDHGDGRHA